MKHKKYRVLCSILAAVLMAGSLSSAGFAADSGSKAYSLQELIDHAVKSSADLSLYEDKIKVAQRRVAEAKARSEYAAQNFTSPYDQTLEHKKEQLLYPLQRQAELEQLQWEKDDKTRRLKLDITRLYYQILLKQQQIEKQSAAVERAKNEYQAQKKKVELGTAADSTLLPLEIAQEQAVAKINTLQKDKDKLVMDMNNTAGFSLDQPLTLKQADLPEADLGTPDLDKIIAGLLSSKYSLKKIQNDKAVTEQERWLTASFNTSGSPNDSAVNALDDKLLNAGYDLRDEKINIEYKVRSDYNTVQNLKDDITIKKLEYDKAVKLADTAKLRYDLGLVSALDYQKAQGDVDDAWTAYQQARLDYYMAVQEFKDYIENR
ncbi:MAG: TolC family protein [Clostridiales bacterium]|jgi:outer membrane protein TolC|nr:TolC family protein [Eubacteriales bacterium]MDH7567782.1 TolC family protein [Clostridiales bacterium]